MTIGWMPGQEGDYHAAQAADRLIRAGFGKGPAPEADEAEDLDAREAELNEDMALIQSALDAVHAKQDHATFGDSGARE
jgi:hypothetical protein